MEHTIFDAIDKAFDPTGEHRTVAKGMNMNQRGEAIEKMWGSFKDPVAVGLDACRFDQHINQMLLEHEHAIFKLFSEADISGLPTLADLLELQMNNTGIYYGPDGKIKYGVCGSRMSGDMNTGSGNVIVMCTLMQRFFEHQGLANQVKLLNDGDDCVIVMERKRLEQFSAGLKDWFLKRGIEMEYDGIYRAIEDIEFCQSRPVIVGGKYRLMPRPSKRLYSDLICDKRMDCKKVYNKMLGAIAGCGLAQSSGVPVFQSFYEWLGTGATAWIPEAGSHYERYRDCLVDNMEMRHADVSTESRVSFYFAFGILPHEQVRLEEYYANLAPPLFSSCVDKPFRKLDDLQLFCPPEQKNQ